MEWQITEISELMLQQDFTKSQHIPSEVNQALALARKSISSQTPGTALHENPPEQSYKTVEQ